MAQFPEDLESRLQQLPDRRLPVLYFFFAHLSLLVAFGTMAWSPAAIAGAA